MSELLRAVLTETCVFSRPKWYSCKTGIAVEPATGQTLTSRIRIQNDTYFMVMAICFQEIENPGENNGGIVLPNQQNASISIFDFATSFNYQTAPINIQNSSNCINSLTDLDEYFVIPSDRDFGVSILLGHNNYTFAPNSRTYQITFSGIEYKFAKKINLDHMRRVAMAYTPPPLQKHNDFVPFL